MQGFLENIEKLTKENQNFRKVLYTAKFSQLVLMSLKPGEDIGEEVHEQDQFFRIDAGQGEVMIDQTKRAVSDGFAVVVPAGAKHNVINTSDTEDLKLYTIYSGPHHKDGTIHPTKQEAMEHEEEFDGVTTE